MWLNSVVCEGVGVGFAICEALSQAPASKAGDVVGGSGAKVKGDSLFGSIMKEEEELEMIKTLPADSALRYTHVSPQCTHGLVLSLRVKLIVDARLSNKTLSI